MRDWIGQYIQRFGSPAPTATSSELVREVTWCSLLRGWPKAMIGLLVILLITCTCHAGCETKEERAILGAFNKEWLHTNTTWEEDPDEVENMMWYGVLVLVPGVNVKGKVNMNRLLLVCTYSYCPGQPKHLGPGIRPSPSPKHQKACDKACHTGTLSFLWVNTTTRKNFSKRESRPTMSVYYV